MSKISQETMDSKIIEIGKLLNGISSHESQRILETVILRLPVNSIVKFD